MDIASQILDILRTWQRQQAGELLSRLKVSRPSLMRALKVLNGQVITRGNARRTTYAARRAIRGSNISYPLYVVDERGLTHECGILEPTYPGGCAISLDASNKRPFPWPLDSEMSDGWFRGVPYPLGDMRPQGFLGRNFAHQYGPLLQVDENVARWSEDDVLHVLSILGWDQPGAYILGEQALRLFLQHQQNEPVYLRDEDIETQYPQLALAALNFGVSGSSAGGKFPKFTAIRWRNRPYHVIVKFSGIVDSPQERRWADLLICEHLALNCIAQHLHIIAAQSRVYQFSGRTFYEVERFDRHGDFGRSVVCSWHEMNSALFGGTGTWTEGAAALFSSDYISKETLEQIELLQHFGNLIGNTDMHDGNLSFLSTLCLAPVYDMLPMLYAPQRGVELVERKFNPPSPLPKERARWLRAAHAAINFWSSVECDLRVSPSFRAIALVNANYIEKLISMHKP